MKVPRWLYNRFDAPDVLTTRVFGSRRTLLSLFVVSARDGWKVYILSLRAWMVTVGSEGAVEEGWYDVRESCPGARRRNWRLKDGRVVQLSYAPAPSPDTDEGERR